MYDAFLQMKLFQFVFMYLILSIIIGVLSGMRIKNASDFVNAGRNLSLPFVIAMVFATWFGSEAILGIPAEFIKEGFSGIIKDPFGAFFCLSIVGAIMAKRWYRLKVITLANIYEKRFGSKVEIIMTLSIVVSYFGWVAAQMTAMGILIHILSGGLIPQDVAIVMGASVVLLYTISGGMLSIAINDFVQFLVIVVSLLYMLFYFTGEAGGITKVIQQANDDKMFFFIKNFDRHSMIEFFGALITLMLGSIPQQDIFQRVTSAKSEKVARNGMLLGAGFYLTFCLIPIILIVCAKMIEPTLVNKYLETDSQMILPTFILKNTPLILQVMFFGALISAIMSTASGTLLAPSVTITENIVKKMFPKITDKMYILALRLTILCTGLAVTIFAIKSTSTIYEMVGDAYKITLVTAVIPLFAAMFWRRATTLGALFSISLGFVVWIGGEISSISQPQLFGFLASFFGMIIGSYLSKKQDVCTIESVIHPTPIKPKPAKIKKKATIFI